MQIAGQKPLYTDDARMQSILCRAFELDKPVLVTDDVGRLTRVKLNVP